MCVCLRVCVAVRSKLLSSSDIWNEWRRTRLSKCKIISAARRRSMPSFLSRGIGSGSHQLYLGLNIFSSLFVQRESWSEIAVKGQKKWVYFILSHCLEPSGKCNSRSLSYKQMAGLRLPDPQLRWYVVESLPVSPLESRKDARVCGSSSTTAFWLCRKRDPFGLVKSDSFYYSLFSRAFCQHFHPLSHESTSDMCRPSQTDLVWTRACLRALFPVFC